MQNCRTVIFRTFYGFPISNGYGKTLEILCSPINPQVYRPKLICTLDTIGFQHSQSMEIENTIDSLHFQIVWSKKRTDGNFLSFHNSQSFYVSMVDYIVKMIEAEKISYISF